MTNFRFEEKVTVFRHKHLPLVLFCFYHDYRAGTSLKIRVLLSEMSISRFIQHSLKRFREIRNSTKPLPNPDWYVPPPDRSLTKLKLFV